MSLSFSKRALKILNQLISRKKYDIPHYPELIRTLTCCVNKLNYQGASKKYLLPSGIVF